MDYSNSFQLAADFVFYTNSNIFLTGKAGTGKTTFLKHCKENSIKNTAIVAPTGVAAMNAGGTTIHSFFQLPFNPFIPAIRMFNGDDGANDKNSLLSRMKLTSERREVMRNLELLIIDEISMVRCDVLDAIDVVLRHVRNQYNKAFGGVQVLLIGDMYQLPPVVKEEEWKILEPHYKSQYFFNSQIVESEPLMYVALEKIYRQNDPRFVNVLNQVRNNAMDEEGYALLHSRFDPNFLPTENQEYITLTTHNHKADTINAFELNKLSSSENIFEAMVEGEFYEKSFPADEKLKLKVGAQVMFIKNDSEKIRRYFNGKIGIIENIETDKITVMCKGDDAAIEVSKEKWKNIKYSVDKVSNKVEEDEIGSFTQYPLRLAWAITIHKSQGLTFERAVIDAGQAFAAGQVYVALSRCTNLEGMVLRSKILPQSLRSDDRIVQFSNTQQSTDQQKELLQQAKNKYQSDEIKTAFQFSEMHNLSAEILEYLKKEKASFNTDAVQTFSEIQESITNIYQIGEKFQMQLNEIFSNEMLPEQNETLQVRIRAAAKHFTKETGKINTSIERIFIETDSKILATDLHKKLQKLYDEVCFKNHVAQGNVNGFAINAHLQHKRSHKKKPLSLKLYSGVTDIHSTNTPHADLYQMLKKKRDEICNEKNLPVYLVAKTATLNEMVLYLPQTTTQLNTISGFGPVKSKQYGKAFLDIICAYCEEHQISSSAFENIELSSKPKKQTALKTEKKEKTDTKAISFNLYKSGKTIDEIALERKMNTTTIEGHLTHFIQLGELEVSEMVTPEKIKEIKAAVKKYGHSSLKTLKENLQENIGYAELKMVLAAENQHVEN